MDNTNQFYIIFNGFCIAVALGLLALSLYIADIDLSTKGYWGMGVLFLSGSIVNLVKLKFDERAENELANQVKRAKNEKLVTEFAAKA